VQQEHLELTEHKVQQDLKVVQDQQEHKDNQELMVVLDQRELKEQLDH
jgi:hypothetical protein